ncbi:MAG: response regulator [Anaerostipes sp.]|jgi:signal transduction histidine kinase/ActR/RegA family two-component response regulator
MNTTIHINQREQQLLDQIDCGICIYHVDKAFHFTLEYVNDGFCQLMDGTKEDVRAAFDKDTLFGVEDSDRAKVKSQIYRGVETRENTEITYQARTLTQEPRWCTLRLNYDTYDGETTIIYATYFDVTRLKKSEKELEEKYEIEKKRGAKNKNTLLSHACFNLNKGNCLELEWNDVFLENESVDTFERLGEQMGSYMIDPNEKEKYLALHQKEHLLREHKTGEEINSEYQILLPNGKIIWVHNLIHLVKAPTGDDILVFEYCYDVNKDKTVQIMMHFAVNDDYDLLGCVNFKDNNAVMLFGQNSYNIHKSDLVEEDYTISLLRFTNHSVIPEEREEYFKKASIQNIRQALAHHNSYEFYMHMTNKRGEKRAKKLRYIRYDDVQDTCLFIQTDITLLLEKEKKKRLELEKALNTAKIASKSKSTFLAQMSHEIRTPMNAITGMTRLAMEENNPYEIKNYLNKIDSSSQYLLNIINDILDMSRIENGKFELRPEWMIGSDIIKECIDMLAPEMEKKNITFLYPDIDKHDMTEWYIDGLRVQQVFMNLLNNALKFTPQGGTIQLLVKPMEEDGKHRVDQVQIKDTGCGMSQDFLTRIFQPFEQEINPYSKEICGTGLGLTIVKQIITFMNGNITVESELGKGSTFTFTFPYDYRPLTKVPDKLISADTKDLEGKHILLVDDHPLNCEIAKKLLKSRGLAVTEAGDGLEALEIFTSSNQGHFDAILMDIRMPRMNGLEASREIRNLDRKDAREIPIIAMTANAFDEDVQESLNAGMNLHLAKPMKPSILYQSLLNLILK